MTQPKDFYQKKYEALKEIQHDLEQIIGKADKRMLYEAAIADKPDNLIYRLLEQHLRAEIARLDFPLANVERKMHE